MYSWILRDGGIGRVWEFNICNIVAETLFSVTFVQRFVQKCLYLQQI